MAKWNGEYAMTSAKALRILRQLKYSIRSIMEQEKDVELSTQAHAGVLSCQLLPKESLSSKCLSKHSEEN